MVSVPRPHVDPAAIARLRPTAPVVRNIRREVILPPRMKKLSAISTVSIRPPISSLCVINSPEQKKTIEDSEEKKPTQKSPSEEKAVVVVTPKRQSIFSSKCKGEPSGKKITHENVARAGSLRKHQAGTVGSKYPGRKSLVTVEEGSMKGKGNTFTSSTRNLISSGRRSVDVTRTSRGQPFQTNTDIKRSASVKSPNLSKNLDPCDECD
ncbi:uncharacterized protein MELLADRAFT_106777 [Melampsora larici-populina 98AG31]|uniref:Uncharacterized protein n=1 Tax=Melampsora larici-populina (strain 98AG31 / pathotype 3-4-7) TaxID=747676 RepID=F4RML8_MELLP|nr:uncharacterized protein MELLADRAFT_106777 [Melampsora larici-populina 98AG31]EGG06442.1 hypothetical protein MELLADRAFT_106777 [Melampsora larici-populina 98AG31]